PSGTPASITVTLDQPGLFVGFKFFDDSGASPVQITGEEGQINGVFPALNFSGVSYRVKLPGTPSKWFIANIAVYTDGTYTTVDTDEPQGDDSIYFEIPAGSGPTIVMG